MPAVLNDFQLALAALVVDHDSFSRNGGTSDFLLKESRRLTTMVEELLEFTKMQDGRFTLRVESVDLASELEDAIYTYRELFRQEGFPF